jgi:hypothetical protein
MSIVLDGVTLPDDLIWEDEFEWSEVDRHDSPEFTLGGAPIFEESPKTAGRPITLVAKNEFKGPIWLSRSTVLALQAKVNIQNHPMTLVMADNRTFTVRFRGTGIKADAVYHVSYHIDTDPYYLTILLITSE